MKKHIYNLTPLEFFKALADDTRLRCLLLIQQEGELCVCELMEALEETQPKISRHLAQLRQSGLLASRRQGQWMFYRIAEDLPDWAGQQLQNTLEANSDYIQVNLNLLEDMGNRPNRLQVCCK